MFLCIKESFDYTTGIFYLSILDTKDGVVEVFPLDNIRREFGLNLKNIVINASFESYSNEAHPRFVYNDSCFYAEEDKLCFCLVQSAWKYDVSLGYGRLSIYTIGLDSKEYCFNVATGSSYNFDALKLSTYKRIDDNNFYLVLQGYNNTYGFSRSKIVFTKGTNGISITHHSGWIPVRT